VNENAISSGKPSGRASADQDTKQAVNPVGLPGGTFTTWSPLAVQRLPSGPVTIARGSLIAATWKDSAASGSAGEKRATLFDWVTQRFPSGPVVIPVGKVTFCGSYSVTVPSGATFATLSWRATQTLPSGPTVR
jgi:hypothetical protein